MDDIDTYQIQILGQITENDLAAYAPPGLALEPAGPNRTRLTVRTDQAGLVALIRRLHGLGFRLLSIQSAAADATNPQCL